MKNGEFSTYYIMMYFKQINKIKEESQELMRKVIGHKKNVTNEVEAYYNNLIIKRNELQKVQVDLNHLIQNSHVTEKVKQRKRITKELGKIALDEPAITKPQALTQKRKLNNILIFLANTFKINILLLAYKYTWNSNISSFVLNFQHFLQLATIF